MGGTKRSPEQLIRDIRSRGDTEIETDIVSFKSKIDYFNIYFQGKGETIEEVLSKGQT